MKYAYMQKNMPTTLSIGYTSCLPFLFAYVLPIMTYAQADTTWLTTIASESELLIDAIVPALIVLAFFLFVWGVVVFVLQTGDDASRASGKKKMVWGLLGLFILISVWGILALFKEIAGVPDNETFNAPRAVLSPP